MPGVEWEWIDRKARASHGLIPVQDSGLSKGQLQRARERGLVTSPQPRVLRLAGSPRTPQQQLLAAVWSAGGLAAASHRSAAALWGLVDQWPSCPEICVPTNRRPRLHGVSVHRSTALVPELVSAVGRIPATNPMLTLIQLGQVAEPRAVADGVERGLIERLFTMDGLLAVLVDVGRSGRDGSGVLREVLVQRSLGDARPESVLESRMAAVFNRYDLPAPCFQYEIRDDGMLVARVDFAYPEPKIVIEVDGWSVHGTAHATRLDFERQNEIEQLGWLVLRFTWYDVVRRPHYVAGQIQRALRTRRTA